MTKLIVFLVVIPTSAALAFAPYEYAVTGVRSDNVLDVRDDPHLFSFTSAKPTPELGPLCLSEPGRTC